ncbi:hypothetical protein F5X99DRAFT_414053 [Biscogniauxia marginata]|nr:hypothetical protein F5X99DRAFT_414053 [Biscogniauxia marginata]
MTTIDELEEMDFIDWDAAAASTGFDLPAVSEGVSRPVDAAVSGSLDEPNMDLVFGNVDGDDWSYWALEHFESTQMPQDVDASAYPDLEEPPPATPQMYWETPEAPCIHCAEGSYQCKRIQEGKYRGYCTSCVALRCECSFGPSTNNLTAEAGETFPANPWPIMGDRPATSILHEDDLAAIISSAPSAPSLAAVAGDQPTSPKAPSMPKIGARFSRESVKVLKNWLVTHSRHPYPTDEEKENLQKITGLNKTQITNWLANARRRGKVQPTRATSPHVGGGYAQAIDIPKRPRTPRLLENMNPLQRWANSPPENEPASVTAIARAVSASDSYSQTSGSGRNSPYISNYSDDGSSKSLCNQSSASSLGTSHSSGGSFASLYSNQSRASFGSIPSFVRNSRGRRRRRRAPPKRADENIGQPLKTFQCTFCTETFRTKHDWQRHEKSLHLSLERWVCSPDGSRSVNPENGMVSCVFCGQSNPDDAHVESHNYSGCTERTKEERTFYRKDHLRQHLRLVHDVKYLPWAMEKWRVASPEIRSRCGFCGVVLDSWTVRVDHLAEHFKTGNTMADWKGDWGFEAPVLEMVENSIPPYLIHDERKTPLPYMASQPSPSTPNNAYELLKLELQYWIPNKTDDTGQGPTDADIQKEACRIIFGAEVFTHGDPVESPSWLRDLIMSSEEVRRQALFKPIRGQSENRMSTLRINGKRNIFEQCVFEKQLHEFVHAKQLLGLTAMDSELQMEACRIIGRIEEKSSNPSEVLANWILRLINSSSKWLQDFRQRAHLPRSEDVGDAFQRSKDPKTIDSTIHNYTRLDTELGQYLQQQRSLGIEPTDAVLQRQARIIIYEQDDEWNQTAADDRAWLDNFKQRYPPKTPTTLSTSHSSSSSNKLPFTGRAPSARESGFSGEIASNAMGQPQSADQPAYIRAGPYFMNDANCYRRLARGLSRFVAATTSPNNPNCHVPTDEELQHQARWIVYDDDDPWNQTAADNAEWLQRLKVDVGILPPESGPGLTTGDIAWAPSEGGTGFAPPYVAPNPAATIAPLGLPEQQQQQQQQQQQPRDNHHHSRAQDKRSVVFLRDEARGFQSDAATANHFLQTFTRRYPAPARVFCSRELESGLTEYVRRELRRSSAASGGGGEGGGGGGGGIFPGDEQLRARAREIMGMQKTPCDDPVLLGKFKAALRGQGIGGAATATAPSSSGLPPSAFSPSLPIGGSGALGLGMTTATTTSALTAGLFSPAAAAASSSPAAATAGQAASLPAEMDLDFDFDLHFTEQEINDILQDVSPELGGGANAHADANTNPDLDPNPHPHPHLNPSPTSSSSLSSLSQSGATFEFQPEFSY